MAIAKRFTKQYGYTITATGALESVQQYADASGCYLLRETGALRCGRLDGLLVPVRWDSPLGRGIYGIEVKIDRGDFLRGLNGGQFARYDAAVNGLYIATPYGIAKSAEIPKGIGHLIVGRRDGKAICVCKRHCKRKDTVIEPDAMWRVIHDLFDQFSRNERDRKCKDIEFRENMKAEVGNRFSKMIFKGFESK